MNKLNPVLSTLRKYALLLILLCGIILCIYPTSNSDMHNIFLSIGCSLIATSVASYILQPAENPMLKEHTLAILQELGIDVPQVKRENHARSFKASVTANHFDDTVNSELDKITIHSRHEVGQYGIQELDYYIDLIGASCDPDTAVRFARLMSTFLRYNSANPSVISNPEFDFVVTPKGGSPILGYEFAKLCKKPFVLHENKDRIHGTTNDMRKRFNFSGELPKNGTALIVDDSTTGGTMVIEAAKDLVEFGFKVNTCLVVFAPQVKNVEEILQNSIPPIQLVPIKRTHMENSSKQKDA